MASAPGDPTMRELLLREFFEGQATAADLARDLVGTRGAAEPYGVRASAAYRIEPMTSTFRVAPAHLVRLVDARLARALSEADLATVCFCLEGVSVERFRWDADSDDGERVANALFWLGTPEINYPLTDVVLAKIRHYLLTGENALVPADALRHHA